MFSTKLSIPIIEQHQKTECGLCCVAMISSYYKHEVTMEELREVLETGRDGTNFIQLIEMLESIGFETNAFKVPNFKDKYKNIKTPCIALWKSRHFIIIEKISKKYIYVVDPEVGKIRYSYDDFADGFSEYLIQIILSKKVEKRKKRIDYRLVFNSIFKEWKYFIFVFIFTSLTYLLMFFVPIIIKEIINALSQDRQVFELHQYLYLLIFVFVVYYLVILFQGLSILRLRVNIDEGLNVKTIGKLFRLPYKFYSNRSRGDLIYSINSLPNIRELFANRIVTGFLDIGIVIAIGSYLYLLNSYLLLTCTILFLVNLVILYIFRQIIEQNKKMSTILQNNLQNKQMEIMYSMMGIKMEGLEQDIYRQWREHYDRYIYRYIATEKFSNFINSLLQTITFVSPFIVLMISMILYSENKLDIGTVISTYSFAGIFFSKTDTIFNTFITLINSKNFISRIYDILVQQEESEGNENIELQGNIRFENVNFSYVNNGKLVLKNINLSIKKGEKIAIVGTSGSGKSTLSKLLVGLYKPTQGSVYFDEFEIEDLNLNNLRKQIGIVPQDMTLFNKTIRENICDGIDVSQNEIELVCLATNIHNDIVGMPLGYNTLVSEMGMNLSGGQRQRIVLARALIKKPKILLLDEATSYLDNINERNIMNFFKEQRITTIVIAHRLSTIIDSDKIFVFENGEIVESGKHEDLMHKENGLYKMMHMTFSKKGE